MIDLRILEPGWAGEISPEEFDFLSVELLADKKLAFQWGFQPKKKRRPAWAIHQIGEFGDPDVRSTNIRLARSRISHKSARNGDFHA